MSLKCIDNAAEMNKYIWYILTQHSDRKGWLARSLAVPALPDNGLGHNPHEVVPGQLLLPGPVQDLGRLLPGGVQHDDPGLRLEDIVDVFRSGNFYLRLNEKPGKE